jgi:hypothetical protein
MKKLLILFLGVIALMSVSCEPMNDIYDDIDTSIKVEGTTDLVLSEDDYSTLNVADNKFSTVDEAKALIPALLKKKYPAFTEKSLATVYFNVNNPTSVEEYTVVAADYSASGLSDVYVTGMSDVEKLLENKFPEAAVGDFVKLTYSIIADEIPYTLVDPDDFVLIQDKLGDKYPDPTYSAANYGNIERRDSKDAYWTDDMIVEALNAVLSDRFEDVEGQKYNVSYAIYDGNSGTESMTVQFDGNAYIAVGGMAYEITGDDYGYIGTELGEAYPGPAGNAAQYKSFDIRTSGNNIWSEDMISEAVTVVLMNNFPDAENGAKFEITYTSFNGSSTALVVQSYILTDGSYVVDNAASVSTIETTQVYSFANGSWTQPLNLETEDYTAMGQSYPNFDDVDELAHKIAILFNNKYPYAEAGDYKSVSYTFYTSGSGTATRYSNFVFQNESFQYISDAMETSLQFGYDGMNWVPDNTIQYSFITADYSLIATDLLGAYPAQAGNLEGYGNFNRSGGSTNWTDDMMLEGINIILDNLDPSAESGQKYLVSYEIYAGGYSTETVGVIKLDGSWEYNN